MKKETASKLWPLLKAYSEGKKIQYNRHHLSWEDVDTLSFNDDDYDKYRIKPEPRYMTRGEVIEFLKNKINIVVCFEGNDGFNHPMIYSFNEPISKYKYRYIDFGQNYRSGDLKFMVEED